VHDHAQIRVRIGYDEEKITEIDGGIFHPVSLDLSVKRRGAAPGISACVQVRLADDGPPAEHPETSRYTYNFTD
jgi:hypothetical protein